jgi:hypothetical protein
MANIVNRFKEPSSWAGIGILLSVVAPYIGIPVDGIDAIISAGAAFCGAAAFFVEEGGD